MFTDTHCHIFKEDYNNIDDILIKASDNKVNRIINNATDIESCKEVLELTKKHPNMYAALGIHPEFAEVYQKEDLKFIEENLDNKKVIAIGEIGLDYHYNKDNKDCQIKLFEDQLKIAQRHQIPVIVHNREATNDIINILKKYKVKGIIHCFNGSKETADIFIKMGFLLGINGVITFKNCKLKTVINQNLKENIVLETDSPYLTPEPFRGDRNEPKNILVIAEFLCDLLDIPLSELEKITNENIYKIFDI